MKQFDVTEMASGGKALILEPVATWEKFPMFSKKWVKLLNAKELSKSVISFDECLQEVEIRGGKFWITYDDFQSSIQLEPKDSDFNYVVIELQMELRNDL